MRPIVGQRSTPLNQPTFRNQGSRAIVDIHFLPASTAVMADKSNLHRVKTSFEHSECFW